MSSSDFVQFAISIKVDESISFALDYREGEAYKDTLARAIDVADEMRGEEFLVLLEALAVTVNGDKVEDHEQAPDLQAGDFVGCVYLPKVELLALAILALIPASGAVAVWGVTYAVIAAYVVMAGAMIGLNYALGALMGPSDADLDTGPGQGSQARRLTGSRNSFALFQPMPRIYGTWKYFPPMAARTYTEVQGDQQFLRQALLWGYGPLDITDIQIGETAIASYDDVEVATETVAATPGPLTHYPGLVTDLSVGANILPVLISSIDPGPPRVVTWNGIGAWTTRTTATDTVEIVAEFLFPRGLGRYGTSGVFYECSFKIACEYRVSGSADAWVPLELSSNPRLVSNKTRDAFFESFRKSGLTPDTYDVRFRREDTVEPGQYYLTKDGGTATLVSQRLDELQWVSLKSFQAGVPVEQPGAVVTSFRIKASDQLNGQVDTVSALVTSKLPTVISGAYSSTAVATSNPAWIALDILVGTANPKPRPTNKVDLDAFEDFAAFCTSEGFEFNHVFDYTGENVYEAVQQALRAGRGSMAMVGDTVTVIWDDTHTSPVQMFNRRNIRSWSKAKVYGEKVDALRVHFKNEDEAYRPDETIVYNTGQTAGTATSFETMELRGPTTADGCWKAARYEQLQAQYRPSVYKFGVDLEVLACRRGDMIRVQEPFQWSARVAAIHLDGSGNVEAITLDESFAFVVGPLFYEISVRSDLGAFTDSLTYNPASLTNYVEVYGSHLAPGSVQVGDLVALGPSGLGGPAGDQYKDLLVTSIRYENGLQAEIEAVDHAPGIFTTLAGETPPAHTTSVTTPNGPLNYVPPAPRIIQIRRELSTAQDGTDVVSAILTLTPGSTTPTASGTTANYRVQYRLAVTWLGPISIPGQWVTMPLVPADSGLVRLPPFTGLDQFDVRVFALSPVSSASAPTLLTGLRIFGDAATPTGLTMEPDLVTTTAGSYASAAFAWDENVDRLAVSWRLKVAVDTEANIVLDTTTTVPTYTMPNAMVGTYYVNLWAMNADGSASLPLTVTFPYDPLVPIAPLRPSGLEILGHSNVGQGADLTFRGSDVAIQWRHSSQVRVPGQVGNPINPLLKDFVVDVLDDDGQVIRQEFTTNHSWTYTHARNVEDHAGRADRSPTFRVRMRDVDDNLSLSQELTATNVAPTELTGVEFGRSLQRVIVVFNGSTDADHDGYIVWGHGSDATVPQVDANILYDGSSGSPLMFELPESSGTYYLRITAFDLFGRDPSNLNVSDVFTVPYASLGAGTIDTVALALDAASALYESNDDDFSLITSSDASGTWKDVVEISTATILGDSGGDNPVLITGIINARVDGVFTNGPVTSPRYASSGYAPVFEYRIVKDLGLGSEEVLYPPSGVEARTSISSAGYMVGGSPSNTVLMSPGVYKVTLQARWVEVLYTEGTAYFSSTSGITGVGTRWADWLVSGYDTTVGLHTYEMEIRIPNVSATWYPVGILYGQANIHTNTAHFETLGSAPGDPYEIRFTTGGSGGPSPVIHCDFASLQLTEKRA